MSRGLLSGLTKAEKRPYEGWKTNSFVQRSGSPENDDVCLLEHDCTTVNVEDSPKSKTCLSDGNRNPQDFDSKDSSYKIPKRSDSPDNKETKAGGTWVVSSFREKDNLHQRNLRTRSPSERLRNHTNRITQKNEIGYRMLRQGQGTSCTPRKWRHASPPGWLKQSRSQQEKTPCKAPDTKCNGAVSINNTEQNGQRTCTLEGEYDRPLLDSILQGKSVSKEDLSKGENSTTNSISSDINFRTKRSITPLRDSLTSSKDILSDDNYDDAFADHCDKCTSRLSQEKKCPSCEKDIFPSQAATPRKPLSPDRFYSIDSQKPKVQRTYNKTRGNGARVLLTGNATKSTDTKNSIGSCQTNSRLKRRKNQGKSNSDSESDYTPGRKKRNGKQLKLSVPKKVDVITLSDEEETEETTAPLVMEECHTSAAGSKSFTLLPESPNSTEEGCGKGEVASDSINTEECSETSAKRKTPPSKEKQPAKKKSNNLHGYTRDDLEIEIMVRQDIRIGTLACTATDPLKITCKTDEIKLSVDYGKKNVLLTIAGNDLTSFKISHGLNPDVIVLGVTPGYALKLAQKIPNQGKFLNPGSAVTAERDIVLEVSEHVKTEVIADLMEWVTDKLSKEFGELSLKEVERIKASKVPPSTSKEQNQSANEATCTLMTTRSRTYNTRSNSCIRPVQAAQTLVVYPPPPQPGGITVTSEDIPCLDSGEFLNDVIIDFYLKFVFFEKLKPEDRARTHILSSFFYKRLTQRNNNNSDTFSSTPDRMHSQVKTWTKNVDIFEKDFVFVPINESSHWYLAVICFAGYTSATYINEITDEDDETSSKNKDSDEDTATEKESENDDDNKDGSDVDDDDFEFTSLATLQSTSTKRNTKRKSLPKQTIKSQPCILVFDSLGGQRSRCMTNLRHYLKVEWRERKRDAEARDFNKDNIKGSHPKVPQQDNYCDCGVYVLQYMESFFEDPITDFSLPIRKDDWFSRKRITQKRNDIRQVIFNLKEAAEIENS